MGWRERVRRMRDRPEPGDRVQHTTSPMTGILLGSTHGLQFETQAWVRVLRGCDGVKVDVPYSMVVQYDELRRMSDLEMIADETPGVRK